MADSQNFQGIKINTDFLKNIQPVNPCGDVVSKIQRSQDEMLQQMQRAKEDKAKEELRRHNELVSELKNAAENGATIVIGDNANGIQIQQHTTDSSQTITNTQVFNYEKVLNVLKEIKGYFDIPQFATTFADNSDVVKQIVEETFNAVERKEEPALITKSLNLLKELAIGAGSSLIASGILALLTTLPK